MFQDITIDELLTLKDKKELVMIDVRSPSEYKDATIPGSLNIPIFDDAERAEIGTLYKQVSVQAAKDRGLEIVSAKLPAFVKTFEQIKVLKIIGQVNTSRSCIKHLTTSRIEFTRQSPKKSTSA